MRPFFFFSILFWLGAVQPEEDMISDEAQFSLSKAIYLLLFPLIFRAPPLLQYSEVFEEPFTTSDKLALIQNKAALRTSIIPKHKNCYYTFGFVQSARSGQLVNREEFAEGTSNLQVSEKIKKQLYSKCMNPLTLSKLHQPKTYSIVWSGLSLCLLDGRI